MMMLIMIILMMIIIIMMMMMAEGMITMLGEKEDIYILYLVSSNHNIGSIYQSVYMVQMSMAHVETYIYIFIYISIWSCILTSKSTYIYVHMYDKFMSCIFLWVPPPAYTPVGYVWTSIYSMEKRYCKRCNSSRDAGAAALYEDRKYCMICLDMEKEKHRRIRENMRKTEKITGRNIVRLK